jgi:hypothetical protein
MDEEKPEDSRIGKTWAYLVIALVLGNYGWHFIARIDAFPFSNFSIFSETRLGERHVTTAYEFIGYSDEGTRIERLGAPLGTTVFRNWARRAKDPALQRKLAELLLRWNEQDLARQRRPVKLAAIELRRTQFIIPSLDASGVERGSSRLLTRYAR